MNDDATDQGVPLGANYRLFDVLGRGAMGEVRRGRTSTGDTVAVKLLRPELAGDPAMIARFLQERAILTALTHPNVVRVRDLVAEGSTLAIVMDLVAGTDLRTHLDARGTLPAAEAAALTVGVLRGLAAVHAAGVVHRDLKPENVLLDDDNQGGAVPRITDFGVSKLLAGSRGTRRTSVIGTPEYMAPELVDDSEPTVASDLYSVGILLYELVCGITPFSGGSALAVLRKHAEAAPGRPAGIPEPLWDVIASLLAKDPARRPGSAAQVATVLESMLPSLAPVSALPRLTEAPPADPDGATVITSVRATEAEAAGPRRRSRRMLVAGAAAAVLLIVLAAGGYALTRGAGTARPTVPVAASVTTSPTPSETASATPTDTPTSTTSASPSDSATPSSSITGEGNPTAVMPELVGTTLASAETALAGLSVRYQVKEVFSSSAQDNLVVAQTPSAGKAAGDLVTVTVSRLGTATYLADVATVDNSDLQPGPVPISGKSYPHGIREQVGCYQPAQWEYDLGRNYRTLNGLVGLTDTSGRSTRTFVEFYLDDRRVFAKSVSLGHPQKVSVDVTGGLRLVVRLTSSSCDDNVSSSFAGGDLALVDATAPSAPAS